MIHLYYGMLQIKDNTSYFEFIVLFYSILEHVMEVRSLRCLSDKQWVSHSQIGNYLSVRAHFFQDAQYWTCLVSLSETMLEDLVSTVIPLDIVDPWICISGHFRVSSRKLHFSVHCVHVMSVLLSPHHSDKSALPSKETVLLLLTVSCSPQ